MKTAAMGTLAALTCLLLTGCATSAFAAKKAEKKARPKYAPVKAALFSAEGPAGWSTLRDWEEIRISKIDSTILRGPVDGDGLGPVIDIAYYPPGNTLFKNAAAYIARQQKPPPFEMENEKTGKPEPLQVDGREAVGFSHDTLAFVPPSSMHTRKIKMSEYYAVVDYGKHFYVISLRAPAEVFKKWQPAYTHVLETFAPAKAVPKKE